MSYKANRSWTFPDYNATTNAIIGVAPPTSAITVTWKYPIVDSNQVTINTVKYCYNCNGVSSEWQTLTSGNECSITGAYCTGYYVSASNPPSNGGGMTIRAYDYNNSIPICTTGCGGPPAYSFTITLSDINWGSDYCFDGPTS